jgi:hypothetical protein
VWPAEPPVDVPSPDEPAGVVAGPLPEEPAEPPGAGAKPPAGAVAEPLPEGLADLPTGAADGPGRPGRRGELPEGLADLPTGAELAAVLATIDRSRLSDADVYDLLAARARQLAHDQAQLLADLLEAGRTGHLRVGVVDDEPAARRGRGPAWLDEFCADESAFTLRWSRPYAHGQTWLAHDLIERLPVVYAALVAGRIDACRAAVFADALRLLDDDVARAIAAKLIGVAEGLTPGELRRRLRYWVVKADASLARQRYLRGVADRHAAPASSSVAATSPPFPSTTARSTPRCARWP